MTTTPPGNPGGGGIVIGVPVFENYPNQNFGNYNYNHMGYVDATFGQAVTAVRLTGLLADEDYAQISATQIECLEITQARCAKTDDQAQKVIEKVSHCATVSQFQALDQKKQVHYINRIHAKGASIRQISRLTGISKGIVERWMKE